MNGAIEGARAIRATPPPALIYAGFEHDGDRSDVAMLMTQTMRWFGPNDPVSLAGIRQAGATEVVTALHDVANGAVWTPEAIAAHRVPIAAAGLGWTVVESLPVHEEIKTAGPRRAELIDAYQHSLRTLAAGGVSVVP